MLQIVITQRNSHLFKVKSTNKCYYFKTTSRLQSHAPNKNIPPDKHDFGDFPSKDASCFWSSHTLFCHMLQRQESLCFWSCFWSSHTLSCHASSDTICSKDKNVESYNSFPTFWDKKWNLLFTVTIHLSLFTDTIHLLLFTPNFCLFKGGCPLYFKQVFSVLSSGLLP